MRIGMILDKAFPPDPRVENEAISLLNNGFEVFLFCLTYKNEDNNISYKEIKLRKYNSNLLLYKFSALTYTFPFYSIYFKYKIQNFIEENNIEILHIHDIQIAESVFWANKKFNLPIVLDLHDNIPEIMKFYPHVNSFLGKLLISPNKWKSKEEEFIHNSTKVITVSKEFVDEVVARTKINKEKIVLVPNSVRKEFYLDAKIENRILQSNKDYFTLLYIGDTGIRRGLITAIKSLIYLVESISNIKLVIVGKSSADNILKEEINNLDVLDFVDYQGWKDQKLLPSYILSSDICISPLERNIQHDVAFPNKLFQYMSLGKPVLVSDATAQKNLVLTTKSGLVHKEKDPEDFANKVLELYHNKNLADELGKNGKEFVRTKFNWDVTSQELINMYKDFERK